MVEVAGKQDLGHALEMALGRILPAGWRATLQPAGTQDGGMDAILDIVSPTGDRSKACDLRLPKLTLLPGMIDTHVHLKHSPPPQDTNPATKTATHRAEAQTAPAQAHCRS